MSAPTPVSLFRRVSPAPDDPILGLMDVFRADPRPDKVNLTVGVFQDESGQTPILSAVRRAEARLIQDQSTKNYFSMAGHPAFSTLIPQLVWDGTAPATATFQTVGGSGALRVVGDFVRRETPSATVWISEPSWPNHRGIFTAAGLPIAPYRYYDQSTATVDFVGMCDDLRKAQPGDVVILHGCCHNPTGADLNVNQWRLLAQQLQQQRLLPVIDLAYQGFAVGIREDSIGLRTIAEICDEVFACISFSKTFGLYRERVGALLAVGQDPSTLASVASVLKVCVRTNYSNPPGHGGSIVATILADESLQSEWEAEVAAMRKRIAHLRADFVQQLRQQGIARDVSVWQSQYGMFALTGLTAAQVDRLRVEFGIYLVGNGRMNVAGLRQQNIERVAASIAAVA